MERAVIIRTTGERAVVGFNKGDSYDLLSKTVGGLIELVRLTEHNADMWVNEEGKYSGLTQNPIATALWADMYGTTDLIMGNVIITADDGEGETVGLSDDQVKFFMDYDKNVIYMGQPTDFNAELV
jgi:hypothetical protein